MVYSNDNGQNWVQIYQDMYGSKCMTFYNNYWFVGGSKGVVRSSNNGQSWEEINTGIENVKVESIAVDSDSGYIFLGTWGKGIYRSTNNGNTWEWNSLENAYPFPLFSTKNGNVYAARGDLFRSEDHGKSWQKLNILPDTLKSPLTSMSTFQNIFIRAIAAGSKEYILVGTDKNGLFLSTNYGNDWHYLGLKGITIFSLAVDKDEYVFAGSDSLRVLKSNESINF